MSPAGPDAPVSVKRLLDQIKSRLEPPFASLCVVGEVGNFRGSGRHWYFTLRDEGASIACAVWASQQRLVGHVPRDGQRVIVRGSLNVYVQGGTFTLAVTHCEPAGAGDLQARLRQLEAELRAEGLFDRPRRPMPRAPRRLGIVAAQGGAALRDVLEVTRRRAPGVDLLVAPAAAQGDRCVPENLAALEALQDPRWGCDAILLVRGGGSLEDLWGYNDPALVRAVAASSLPVVTGVGHEIDVTLVDLAADHRAATPSQAAELATPDRAALEAEVRRRAGLLGEHMAWRLRGLEGTLHQLADSRGMREVPLRVERGHARLQTLLLRLVHADPAGPGRERLEGLAHRLELAQPQKRLEASLHRLALLRQRLLALARCAAREDDRPRVAELRRALPGLIQRLLTARARGRDILAARLEGLDPRAPLQRGFVLARDEAGRPVTSAAGAEPGTLLSLQWLDGVRTARVRATHIGEDAPGEHQ